MRLVDQKALVALAIILVVGSALFLMAPRRQETPGIETHTEPGEEGGNPPVRIGVVSPTKESDWEYRFLARLAECEINAYCNESGIDYRFEFEYRCAHGIAQEALEETQRFHEDGINLVVGCGFSSMLCAAYNHYGDEHGMVIINPRSTSPLACCRKEDRAFRLHPYDGELLRPLALMIRSLGVTDVVVLQLVLSWGDFIREGFGEEFENLGGQIASVIRYDYFIWSEPEEYDEPEESEWFERSIKAFLEDAESALEAVVEEKGKDKVAILAATFDEIAQILRRAGEYPTLLEVAWFSPELPSDPSVVVENAPRAAVKVGLIGCRIHIPDNPIHRRVNETYHEEFGEPLGFIEANVYDGCWIMALSVIEANSTEGVAVYEALPDVAASYSGVTGRCILDEYGDRVEMDYDIWGYFEAEGEPQCLRCGIFNSTTDSVAWNEELIPVIKGEAGFLLPGFMHLAPE